MGNNGYISLREAKPNAIIGPFFGYVDTRGGGSVWYRESVAPSDLTKAESDIKRAYPVDAANFRTSSVFIATWDHVGYFPRRNDKVQYIWFTYFLLTISQEHSY